jgi:hypothetical protein
LAVEVAARRLACRDYSAWSACSRNSVSTCKTGGFSLTSWEATTEKWPSPRGSMYDRGSRRPLAFGIQRLNTDGQLQCFFRWRVLGARIHRIAKTEHQAFGVDLTMRRLLTTSSLITSCVPVALPGYAAAWEIRWAPIPSRWVGLPPKGGRRFSSVTLGSTRWISLGLALNSRFFSQES